MSYQTNSNKQKLMVKFGQMWTIKAPVKCWHFQITIGYLSTSQKLLQVSRIFAVLPILYAFLGESFCLIDKNYKWSWLIYENKCSWK